MQFHRRSIRLPSYDYSQSGAYFVTICVEGKECRLGTITNDLMQLNDIGKITNENWSLQRQAYPNIQIDIYCVMPNHVHAIITIREFNDVSRGRVTLPLSEGVETTPLQSAVTKPTLGQIVARYKYETTKAINKMQDTPSLKFWQRNYYEHIIRNEGEYEAISNYIGANPQNWKNDEEFKPQE